MTFRYSRHGLLGREKKLQRLFEIIPGACSWTLLAGLLLLSVLEPVWAAVLVIALLLYWFLRLLYLTLFLVLSYLRLSIEEETDWRAFIQELESPTRNGVSEADLPHWTDWRKRFSVWIHRREIRAAREKTAPFPRLKEIVHLVIFPVVKESEEIYAQGVASLLDQQIPAKRVMVALAIEERASAEIKAGAFRIAARYRNRFLALELTLHPDGLPGESRVKGANVTFAAKRAADLLVQKGIRPENVILSCLDADTVLSPRYLACLTYHFMICPWRTRASFQPIPVYHNNIWEVPGFARVLDVGSSFFQLIEATNPEKLVTFSSHSMSFQALQEVGYWPVDMISDDSAIFWKAFIHYEGDYRVVPMYVMVSMDVAASGRWQQTALNVYQQKRRWAWGVENFPIVMRAFLASSRIPLLNRVKHGVKLLDGHVSWATWPFLLTFIAWLPALLVGREYSTTVLLYTSPRITWTIFRLASVSLITSIVLSILLLPRAPVRRPLLKQIQHLAEWLLVPLISIFFSAIPALDAQTRLALGRHLEFWVTEKRRAS